MMNRMTSLVAVLGLSLAGAACQSGGGFSTASDNNTEFNSTNSASNTDIRSSDKMNVHDNLHSNDQNSPTARSGNDMGQFGNPDGTNRPDSTNSGGTAIDR